MRWNVEGPVLMDGAFGIGQRRLALFDRGSGWNLVEPGRLVLDRYRDLAEAVFVVAPVVAAKEQLGPGGEDCSNVRLRTATVAAISCSQWGQIDRRGHLGTSSQLVSRYVCPADPG